MKNMRETLTSPTWIDSSHMSTAATIHLRGVRVHNLKGVDVDLPLGRLSVICGVSGAGKSSLALDTLYAESQRRYWQSFSTYARQFLERLDKPDADQIDHLPPAIALRRSVPRGQRATVGTLTEIVDYLRLLFSRAGTVRCKQCGQEVRGRHAEDVLALVQSWPNGARFSVAFPAPAGFQDDRQTWIAGLKEEGFLRIQVGPAIYRLGEQELPDPLPEDNVWVLVDRLETGTLSPERLLDSVETAFARGQGRLALLTERGPFPFDRRFVCARCNLEYQPPEPRLFNFNDPLGACPVCSGTGTLSGKSAGTCPSCRGTRLGELALRVFLNGKNLGDICDRTVAENLRFFAALNVDDEHQRAGRLLREQIRSRLGLLSDVGLDYLTLSRSAGSLSTGEAQRIRLTTALGSNLVNALYVLDEPSAGLHPRDVERLLAVLRRLRDAGNTLVVVEHNPVILAAAEHVVDLGPGAGEEGGEVLYQGPIDGLRHCEASITGGYLSGRRLITVPARRRPCSHGSLRLVGARRHNLKNLTVDFPLGVLCAVTGVSGAGKTTLVQHTLYPALCRRKNKKLPAGLGEADLEDIEVHGAGQLGDVVRMDQSPLPRNARISPVTYLKAFDEIRQVFADTTEARIRNFEPGTFSFNQPGGRCEACEGQGTLTVDMQFLADVTMTCPECHGTRFQAEVLKIKVRNLSIAEVLSLTVREAFRFFRAQRAIEKRLKLLLDVGLDYLRLGQSAETLSGGECQRLKLAGHLSSSRKPRCLFILSEPTAGLHPADVARLLDCFDRLLETGHSLIVIEHNLDVIKCADWVIDLGPGAGSAGGSIVALGTPEEVAETDGSLTGRYLRPRLKKGL